MVAMSSAGWAALGPILVVFVVFVVYCMVDIARSNVRYMPKWAWVLVCLISIPAGGIVYLLIGRDRA